MVKISTIIFLTILFLPFRSVSQEIIIFSGIEKGDTIRYLIQKIAQKNTNNFQEKRESVNTLLSYLDTEAIVETFGIHGTLLDVMEIKEFLKRLKFGGYGEPDNFEIYIKSDKEVILRFVLEDEEERQRLREEIVYEVPMMSIPKRRQRDRRKRTEDIDVTIGEPEMEMPEVEIEVETPAVVVVVDEPEIEAETPKFKRPKRERRNKRTEDIDVTIGEPEMEMPKVEVEAPAIEVIVDEPEVEAETPKFKRPTRDRYIKAIDITVVEPETSVVEINKEPTVEVVIEEPKVEIEISKIQKRLQELRARKAQIEQEIQELKQPDIKIITEIIDGKKVTTVWKREF